MSHNFNISIVDTDSISFCNYNGVSLDKNQIDQLIKELNDISPEFMIWENDGYYDKILAIKAKNYVLVDGDDIVYKGSSIVDQKKEPAMREFMESMISELLNEAPQERLLAVYNRYVKEALNITDINRWLVKKTITEKVLEGDRKNETKVKDAIGTDHFQEGDKIWVYNAIYGIVPVLDEDGNPKLDRKGQPKMEPNCVLKQGKHWNGDHDSWHYVKRVYDTVKIFQNVVDLSIFPKYTNNKLREEALKL